ncbi:hypothetical protein PSE_p0118 (plasmid) [Pseudovibrio sp. FO-BEG1]|nr:hypothetical protein PSE_p0118 [Pseudovibrio sp. FO-BEG1]
MEVVISLEQDTHGKLYVIHFGPGPDENEPVMRAHLIANSFREFIYEKLFETPDKFGYDYWYRPVPENLIKKVEF